MVTHVSDRTLSTAERRRAEIIDAAVGVFAESGYSGSTVAQVGRAAGVSPAYVFKLFPSKGALFAAALARCFERVEETLRGAAESVRGHEPQAVLDAMADAYAGLIRDRSLLLLQVHAMSAAHQVEGVEAALREGIARVVRAVSTSSGADDAAVQRFVAFGQLCHLIVTADIDGADGAWAALLTRGIRHLD